MSNFIIKDIDYKGKLFSIKYSYHEKDEVTFYQLELFKINNLEVPNYIYHFRDSCNKRISIINEVKKMLDYYLNKYVENSINKFSYYNEYKKWNGELDNWDK